MMFVRLALESDFQDILEMAKINAAETRKERMLNPAKVRKTFDNYLEYASPTFWVCEQRRVNVGFFVGEMHDHRAFDGLFTVQEVLFVRPEYRGSRAAALLMKNFIRWSEQIGANEIVGGNDNSFNSERTAKFLEHFGFERVGFAMRRSL